MFERIKLFFLEASEEFKRVNWPNREETVKMVAVVAVVSLTVAAFLGLIDFVLFSLLGKIL